MDNRFKFRAWDKEKEIMVYCWSEATEEQKEKYCDIYGKDEVYNCWQSCQLCCLEDYDERFIIEQCTGLKDKNGKLIYENDKIKDWKNNRFVIAFDGQYAQFVAKDENGWVPPIEREVLVECEIIGNIHSNADLLGEE